MRAVAGQVQIDEQQTSDIGALADGYITAVDILPGAMMSSVPSVELRTDRVSHESAT